MNKIIRIFSIALALFAAPYNALADELICNSELSIEPAHITLFGEIHGTNESPFVVGEYVCSLARANNTVVLVLEIPESEQSLIESFLNSEGKRSDRRELLSSKFWQSDFQDGRSSVAIFELIDRVREIRQLGYRVYVIADDGTSEQDYDLRIAQVIQREARRLPNTYVVGLFGNYHTGEIKGTRSDPEHQRVGYRLKSSNPRTISIEFPRGWSWSCTSICGVQKVGGWKEIVRDATYEITKDERNGHDAILVLPRVTASPPAKFMNNDG